MRCGLGRLAPSAAKQGRAHQRRAVRAGGAEETCTRLWRLTSRVKLRVEERPSPVAVTVTGEEPARAKTVVRRVSAVVMLALPEADVAKAKGEVVVTPMGRPVSLKATVPEKDPSVAAVTTATAALPCTMVTVAGTEVSASVGEATAVVGQ